MTREQRFGVVQALLNPTTPTASNSSEQTFTVPGLKVGDVVFVCKPSLTTGVGITNARVSAADTLALQFTANGAPGDPASETYLVFWLRDERAPNQPTVVSAD
jgi:hypothetical protein